MEAEIVFTGLCAFNNLYDHNETMGEPSVVLVRADHAGHEHHGNPDDHIHIPYIAFHSTKATVNDEAGFQPVAGSVTFKFLPLDGVELSIANDPPSKPYVDPSYDSVVKKDDYWPEVANQWDRDLVPERGKKPNKNKAVAFMRFGQGTISAARICPFKWEFKSDDKTIVKDNFAEEVIYSKFAGKEKDVVMRLTDLATGELVRELRFAPKDEKDKLILHIGNNVKRDMDNAVERRPPRVIAEADHFKFLNRVAAARDSGPIPAAVEGPPPPPPGSGGGGVGGVCGPINSNGKPTG